MNSMKFVIPLHSLYGSIHPKDEGKQRTTFAFQFGVNWLWGCGVTALFGVFFHEMKCHGMTSFMEFMWDVPWVHSLFRVCCSLSDVLLMISAALPAGSWLFITHHVPCARHGVINSVSNNVMANAMRSQGPSSKKTHLSSFNTGICLP